MKPLWQEMGKLAEDKRAFYRETRDSLHGITDEEMAALSRPIHMPNRTVTIQVRIQVVGWGEITPIRDCDIEVE